MGLEFDSSFIQESDHRPKQSARPVASRSSTSHPYPPTGGDHIPEPPNSFIAKVESACRQWGFFQVINHGVPFELLEGIQSAAREFFSLPMGEKRKVRRDEENPLGYYDAEHTKNVRDWKEVFDFAANETVYIPTTTTMGEGMIKNQWPEYPPQMRAVCIEYRKAMEDLSYRLLELIALTLKLPAKQFNNYFRDSSSFVRINYYPPCPSPHLALGVGRHEDTGALTILAQDDVGGLDVKRKSDGEWVRVKPIPDSYIINIGDIIQIST